MKIIFKQTLAKFQEAERSECAHPLFEEGLGKMFDVIVQLLNLTPTNET